MVYKTKREKKELCCNFRKEYSRHFHVRNCGARCEKLLPTNLEGFALDLACKIWCPRQKVKTKLPLFLYLECLFQLLKKKMLIFPPCWLSVDQFLFWYYDIFSELPCLKILQLELNSQMALRPVKGRRWWWTTVVGEETVQQRSLLWLMANKWSRCNGWNVQIFDKIWIQPGKINIKC